MAIHIQVLSKGDFSLLSHLSRQSFQEAFEKDNDPDYFQQYLDRAFSPSQMKGELEDPNSFFFVARERGIAAGYVKLVKDKHPISFPMQRATELQRIYVLNRYQGKKIGKMLMEKALDVARSIPSELIWLGVWEHNPRAIKFYQSFGFVEFGTHGFPMGPEIQTDILMKKIL